MATEKLKIKVDVDGVSTAKSQLNKMSTATGGASSSFTKMAGIIGGATAALYLGQKAFTAIVEVGKDFEKGMANLKSISGATEAELGTLEATSMKLGASTAFTAGEVTNLMTEYAKLGFKPEEIDQATESTLKLAGAFGVSLDQAASVAGGTLRAFGLDASETERVTNVMASSFGSSALDMDKFANSMKYVAPIASAVGFEVEEVSTILGTLADKSISGSQAGTALRKIMLSLGNENSILASRMGGTATSMDELKERMMHLKESGFDPVNDGATLVGRNAVTAFTALYQSMTDNETSIKKMDELNDTLYGGSDSFDCFGSATGMYNIQMDTTQGRLDVLKSATEALGITIFGTFKESF